MSLVVNCPCGMRVAENPASAGGVTHCPSCGRQLHVPAPLAAVPAWHASPGSPPKKPKTLLWVIAGTALAIVLVLIVIVGVIGLSPALQPAVQQDPGGGPIDAPSAVPTDGPAAPRPRPNEVPPTPWTVVADPDPDPAPQFEASPLVLAEGEMLERLLFASPAAAQAVMQTTNFQDAEHQALSRIDLKSGRTLARASVDRWDKLLAVSPDGELLLIDTHANDPRRLDVFRWVGDAIRPAGAIVLERPPGHNVPVRFLDHQHLLLADTSNGGASKWEIASGRRLFAVPFRGQAALVVSPGRRYFVIRESYADTLSLYETATGRRAGVLRAPRRNRQSFVVSGFRRDGKVLTALVQERNQGRSLIGWDVATGSLVDYVTMTNSHVGAGDPLVWFDDRFVAAFDLTSANRISLVDLKYDDHVWQYSADSVRYSRSSDKIGADPAGRIWLVRGSRFEGGKNVPGAVVPLRLPRDAELQAIERKYDRGAVLKPGDAVALKMQFQNAPGAGRKAFADRLAGALPELLRKKLTANEVRIEDGAPLQFQAVVSYQVDPSAPRNVRVWYDDGLGLPNYQEIQVANEFVTVELSLTDADGQVLWRRAQICSTGAVGPSLGLPNSQLKNDPGAAAARGPWLEAERWVQELQLPRELHLQRGEPLGTSAVP